MTITPTMPRFLCRPPACGLNLPRQDGAALVIGLIMLFLVTMLSITAMRTSALEERMASHTSERALAFQAAEAALRQGEQYLNSTVIGAFNNTMPHNSGLYKQRVPGFADPYPNDGVEDSCPVTGEICRPWWEALNWAPATNHSRVASGVTGVAQQPRYIIEDVTGPVVCDKDGNCQTTLSNLGGSLKQGTVPETGRYRVTARGVGAQVDDNGNPVTVVFLQSYYQR